MHVEDVTVYEIVDNIAAVAATPDSVTELKMKKSGPVPPAMRVLAEATSDRIVTCPASKTVIARAPSSVVASGAALESVAAPAADH